MSEQSVYLELMRQMGAERYEGFNPIAPRSHRWMMDVSQREEIRVWGWALWRTIDRDLKGQTGPAKKKRTYYAHDTRVPASGHLTDKHMAEDLGMKHSNAIQALEGTVAKGLIRIDEKGRICPRGDCPEPNRFIVDNPGTGEDGKPPIFICTDKSPEDIRLSFQQLDKNRRAQYVRLYWDMPKGFAAHLETLDPEPRARHTWDYLQSAEYKEQLEADALAAARAIGRQVVDRACAEAGYVDAETRGRKEVNRELTIELKVCVEPASFYIQKNGGNSVQSRNSDVYENKNGSVQNPYPYLVSQCSPPDTSEVKRSHVENPASGQEKEAASPRPDPTSPPPTPPQIPSVEEEVEDPLHDPNPVIDIVQHWFGRKLASADPLQTKFPELAAQFSIPLWSVHRWIAEKRDKKEGTRYHVHSPGALYEFALEDIPKWAANRQREIQSDRDYERREREKKSAQKADEKFDPLEYNALMRELKAKTKGMS